MFQSVAHEGTSGLQIPSTQKTEATIEKRTQILLPLNGLLHGQPELAQKPVAPHLHSLGPPTSVQSGLRSVEAVQNAVPSATLPVPPVPAPGRHQTGGRAGVALQQQPHLPAQPELAHQRPAVERQQPVQHLSADLPPTDAQSGGHEAAGVRHHEERRVQERTDTGPRHMKTAPGSAGKAEPGHMV